MTDMDMTPEQARALWVENLRSGAYVQGTGLLASASDEVRPVKYCCLGVACELYRDLHPNSLIVTFDRDHARGRFDYNGDQYALPYVVQRWLGLADRDGRYGSVSLSGKNDDGLTFSEIADIIESAPEGLLATGGTS